MRARRTVSPPKPESKTPMVGGVKELRSRSVSFGRCGFGGQVGAGEVGVAGEGGALLAVDEEADLGDVGKVGVDGRADGEDGEGFGFEAGGVAGGEGAGEVDDGELIAGVWRLWRRERA